MLLHRKVPEARARSSNSFDLLLCPNQRVPGEPEVDLQGHRVCNTTPFHFSESLLTTNCVTGSDFRNKIPQTWGEGLNNIMYVLTVLDIRHQGVGGVGFF